MLQIAPQMHILVAIEPVDLRKGIDGLAQFCREKLAADPFSGWLFLFLNGQRNRLKLLFYDGSGLWVCAKVWRRGVSAGPQSRANK
ncbi:MAG: IS66 family insertion sequence element accessory protein TnpB [Acidobacteriaceae bacterium]|nr:IS66 family insertion sequence element accessory protein TnpB [Acidobacteriaceae bacterium]